MPKIFKCQFCGYAPPNVRDPEGIDTGEPEVWPKDRCSRSITPPPAACGLALEKGAEPMLTDPKFSSRDDLMTAIRTKGSHIADLAAQRKVTKMSEEKPRKGGILPGLTAAGE